MRREEAIERLRDDRFDLLVVGGGITGCGVALDAASRGLSVALVERDDFAAGTSSRSSKLIHGGLRYLQRLEVRLVREALRERQLLQRLAPFLVWPTQFLVPLQRGRPLVAVRAGLVAYDLLAAGSGASRHRRLDQPGARQLAWALGPHVTGAYCYPDARTDDARLVWTIARTAGEMGAVVANHAPVLELLRDTRGRASGAVVSDVETGEPVHVRARAVVNASGVWVDEVRRLEDPAELAGVRPAKGIHLTFPASAIRTTAAMLLPAGDGRYVFVIPWVDSTVIVGTTDDDYTGPLDSPTALPQEVSYLIDTVNSYVDPPVGQQDVLSAWAGLRPLIQKPGRRLKELSRRHSVTIGSAGVVTVAGGKLTTYRTMAAEAVDAAAESAGLGTIRASRTSRIRLSGAGEAVPDERVVAAAAKLGLDSAHQLRLHRRYGTHALDVLDLAEREPELVEPLHPHLPYLLAEAAYAIEFESARRPNDVLGHRLRARITSPDGGRAAAAWVSSRLAMTLAWDERTRAMHMSGYDRLVASERSVRDVLNP